MTDELEQIDPKLASQPADQPAAGDTRPLKTWAALTDEQTQEFNTAYAAVTGG